MIRVNPTTRIDVISIQRTAHGTYLLETEQWLAGRQDKVFRFFSEAANLEAITPPWLKFAIRTRQPIEMHAGTRIDYRLRWHGLPLRWSSEIAVWEPPHLFVDKQIRGPYRLWVHEHLFLEYGNATLMRDRVEYNVLCARIANRLGVERDLRAVFTYRRERLEEMLGQGTSQELRARFVE